MASILTDIVPARYRKIAYLVFALIGLVLGAIQVGYGAASVAQPTWLVVALAVAPFVGSTLGFAAASNVATEAPATDEAARAPRSSGRRRRALANR